MDNLNSWMSIPSTFNPRPKSVPNGPELEGVLIVTNRIHYPPPTPIRSHVLHLAMCSAILTCALIASPALQAQTYQIIYNFNPSVDAASPFGLTRAGAANIIGVTGLPNNGSVFKLNLTTRVLTTLHTFTGTPDGDNPTAPVVLDSAGNIYGTTRRGGANGLGTVFKIDSTGVETILHSFNGTDGKTPNGLIRDPAGNLYGTTVEGGIGGSGVVFRINKSGVEQTLYKFTGPDGAQPYAGLTRDAAGNLYGTTDTGGDFGKGTIFKLAPDGTETVLHSFPGGAGGNRPYAALLIDSAGNLYGSTLAGGTGRLGTIFKLDTSGVFTVLVKFSGANGEAPIWALAMDSSGNFYGTTSRGGGPFDLGVVFKLDPSGTETVLHSFAGRPDGASPSSPLLVYADGTVIGATSQGGLNDAGTIFRIKP
jgi:uncharacterized repeat protein (TIGR03803 family)